MQDTSTALQNIGLIGFGNMGEGVAGGIKSLAGKQLFVAEKDPAKCKSAQEVYNARIVPDIASLCKECDCIIIATKPQDFDTIGDLLNHGDSKKDILYISIMAGITLSTIAKKLNTRKVVRFMPNLAAKYNKSPVGVSFTDDLNSTEENEVIKIADSLGKAITIPEKLMSAITGVSGSGIAFVLACMDAMAMGGVHQGLTFTDSLDTVTALFEGTAVALKESGLHPRDLISKVCSPGGTTIEGMKTLEDGRLNATLMNAVINTAKKADSMS